MLQCNIGDIFGKYKVVKEKKWKIEKSTLFVEDFDLTIRIFVVKENKSIFSINRQEKALTYTV